MTLLRLHAFRPEQPAALGGPGAGAGCRGGAHAAAGSGRPAAARDCRRPRGIGERGGFERPDPPPARTVAPSGIAGPAPAAVPARTAGAGPAVSARRRSPPRLRRLPSRRLPAPVPPVAPVAVAPAPATRCRARPRQESPVRPAPAASVSVPDVPPWEDLPPEAYADPTCRLRARHAAATTRAIPPPRARRRGAFARAGAESRGPVGRPGGGIPSRPAPLPVVRAPEPARSPAAPGCARRHRRCRCTARARRLARPDPRSGWAGWCASSPSTADGSSVVTASCSCACHRASSPARHEPRRGRTPAGSALRGARTHARVAHRDRRHRRTDPAQRDAIERQARHAEAVAALEADPFVRELIEALRRHARREHGETPLISLRGREARPPRRAAAGRNKPTTDPTENTIMMKAVSRA